MLQHRSRDEMHVLYICSDHLHLNSGFYTHLLVVEIKGLS